MLEPEFRILYIRPYLLGGFRDHDRKQQPPNLQVHNSSKRSVLDSEYRRQPTRGHHRAVGAILRLQQFGNVS